MSTCATGTGSRPSARARSLSATSWSRRSATEGRRRAFHVKHPLGELSGGGDLSPAQLAQLGAVLGVLEQDEHAPTAVRDPERAVNIHLSDSLAALDVDAIRSAGVLADLGAGAGFPGLAIAVALSD